MQKERVQHQSQAMAEINARDIKELREVTGASIMMIKRALTEAAGNRIRALEVLKSLGQDAATKKESRETLAGRITSYIHTGARVGVLLEMRSETDFVSRSEEFEALAHGIAMHIAAMNPSDIEMLLAEPYVKNESETVGDMVKKASASFGEHIEIKRFARFEL